MRALVVMVVLLSGCAERGLSILDNEKAPAPLSHFQCVWHFTWTNGSDLDTADSDQRPGVSSCDDLHFALADEVVSVEARSDGAISGVIYSSACSDMTANLISRDKNSWFVDVRGCGAEGFLGANLR